MKAQDVVRSSDHPDLNHPRVVDVLCPPDPCPQWPDTRTYEDVIKLHAQNTEEAAKSERFGVCDFAKDLKEGAAIIDIGAGRGILTSDLRQIAQQKGLKYQLVAVSATEMDAEHIQNADHIYYQKVPDNPELLQDYAQRADLVLDTFGAATYATNPVHALIYSLMLLKPGGKYTAISSLVPGAEDLSAFGDTNTQSALIEFIGEHLGLTVSIKPSYLKSKVIGNEGAIVQDLLIKCERPRGCRQDFHWERFRQLAKQVDQIIGVPEVVSVWSSADFGKFQIRRIQYTQKELVNTVDKVDAKEFSKRAFITNVGRSENQKVLDKLDQRTHHELEGQRLEKNTGL